MRRHARIRFEALRRYPAVEPTHWYPAAVLADYVRRRDGAGETGNRDRILPEHAFEFKGGRPREGAWTPSRRGEGERAKRRSVSSAGPPISDF
jgi:hypothetical protein